MPQPYVGKERPVYGHFALLSRPLLAAHIGAIATLSSTVDEQWGMILATMLGASAEIGVEIYLALTGATSQGAVLNTVATQRLDAAAREHLKGLIKRHRSAATQRNRIVHGRWGILPSETDRLVLFERGWSPRATAALDGFLGRLDATTDPDAVPFVWPDAKPACYTARDFERVEQDLMDVSRELSDFRAMLLRKFRPLWLDEPDRTEASTTGMRPQE